MAPQGHGGDWCSAPNCTNTRHKQAHLSYFRFPVADNERCKLWVINCHLASLDKLPNDKLKNRRLCSDHFEVSQFMNPVRKSLTKKAVPTLFDVEKPPKKLAMKRKHPTRELQDRKMGASESFTQVDYLDNSSSEVSLKGKNLASDILDSANTEQFVGATRLVMDDIDKKLIQDLGAGNMKCQFCGKIYFKLSAMDRHLANHAGKASYFCSLCNKKIRLHSYLHLHIRQHCIREVQCEVCGVQLGAHEILTCHVCHKEFKHRRSFDKHLTGHELEGTFGCGECLMKFKDKESFLAHVHGKECEKSTGGNEMGKMIVVTNPLQKDLMSVSGVVEPKTTSTKEFDMHIYSQVDHPLVCVKTEEPEIFVKTEEPEIFVKTEEPKIFVKTEEPEIFVKTEEPKIFVKTEEPKIFVKTEEPEFFEEHELLNDCESEVDPLAL